jgi:hypothetical protein
VEFGKGEVVEIHRETMAEAEGERRAST